MVERIKRYFSHDLWNFSLRKERGVRYFYLKWLRIICLTGRGFMRDQCSLSASSLTYYTLMSIVPILAMAFAVTRSFGFREVFQTAILKRFQDQHEALLQVFRYAEAFLEEARGGVIAGIGSSLLLMTVILLLSNLERIFNRIWGVKKLRSWKRILTDYFAMVLIGPIFFVAGNSTSVFVVDRLETAIRVFAGQSWVSSWLLFFANLIPYSLFWALFTLIYLLIPNTKVQGSSACVGALFASSLYLLVQWVYLYFQITLGRHSAIYGSMAALPLFLIWVQLSWFIVLFGAEIHCAHQTVEEHEFEGSVSQMSDRFKRLMSLWVLHLALRKGSLTKKVLVQEYHIPPAMALPILEELAEGHLLYETRRGYVPSHEAFVLKISEVLDLLEKKGESDFPFMQPESLEPFAKVLEDFRKSVETSPQNIRLAHVSDPL